MKVVKSRTPESVTVDIDAIPEFEMDGMCKAIIDMVSRMFEDPAVREDFKRWQQARQQRGAGNEVHRIEAQTCK